MRIEEKNLFRQLCEEIDDFKDDIKNGVYTDDGRVRTDDIVVRLEALRLKIKQTIYLSNH